MCDHNFEVLLVLFLSNALKYDSWPSIRKKLNISVLLPVGTNVALCFHRGLYLQAGVGAEHRYI